MHSIKLKQKMLLLTIIPLVVSIVAVMLVVQAKLAELGEKEISTINAELIALKEESLKGFIELAVSTVQPILDNAREIGDAEARKQAADILRTMRYGEANDGYIFVYSYDGVNVVNGPKQTLEGKNLIDLKDPDGVPIIKELISAAKSGGGYVNYKWAKPSKEMDVAKLSYADSIDEFKWMIGTGFYIDDIEDKLAVTQKKVNADIQNTMLIIAALGALLLVVFVLIALWMSSKITRPLRDVAEALADISAGEGDLTRRLTVSTGDEVGLVATGFNNFADKIQHLVVDLKKSIQELSRSTEQMNQVVKKTNADVQRQRHETTQTAAAVHEMAATAQEVASNAGGAASAADQADHATSDGQKEVEATISALQQLYQDVNRSSEVISRLDDDADKIGSVVNVIKEIADQTNLLALNAAIEAARAGEYGRGFSVVADEVRTLANRTQESTQEIQMMIERLLTGAREAVSVMETSRSQGETTVERAAKASESLGVITASVSTINNMNMQIASAAEEQTAVADEISSSVQQIADIAEHSAKNADNLEATTNEMSRLEKRLQSLVGHFKV
ncbi:MULTISPECIES: methyl-accepting chemotaxis protein [Neptunomonas]|uniref:methyl-accepting chemotaxis protein n=1 Tax=Neptunomonas TaxID=75687 RepID=UPI000948C8C8|nr:MULTISPECIES: methyl-accepting chemotaxis protein [Neptunomonas]MBT3146554.1 cache domain-containing protein [Neptunomonas phycophila]MDN2658825.1 methyl-accepting chemotaxis protein [Neptunomonas sp. CHC150]MDO6468981.1 methyl-accepting chemotaxis protein [Neptunomonas phycophila]